jgi:hypothetical protein
MARASTLPVWDRALQGQLKPLLAAWRDEKVPLEEMTFRLRAEHDVKVSARTVRRWLLELEEAES